MADAAAAFHIWFHFLSIFTSPRESGTGHLMGGSFHQGAKINYRQFNPYALAISHSPNNEPNAEWLHMEGKGEKKKEENTSQHRGDSFGTADSLLGYHSLIAAVVRDMEWPGK